MTKHAEWKVKSDLFGWPHVYDQDGCRLSNDRPEFSADEWRAKCDIMAAALDLLEAAEELLTDYAVEILEDAAGTDPNDTDSAKSTVAKFKGLRDAIAKARGQ